MKERKSTREGEEEVGVKAWRVQRLVMEEPIPRTHQYMSQFNFDQNTKPMSKLQLTQAWSSLKEANWPSGLGLNAH